MENYIHEGRAARTCVTAYPNLVTKSQKNKMSCDT